MTAWQPAKTAPKSGDSFLAQIKDYPYIIPCIWSAAVKQWCCAIPMADVFKGEQNDHYFENTWENPDQLLRWLPMPTTP